MIRLSDLKYKTKLTLLTGVFVAGFLLLAVVAFATINLIKVNGPVYAEIVQGKDIVADILPPPLYIVEAEKNVNEMLLEPNAVKREKLVAELRQKKQEYEERHAYWTTNLEAGKLKDCLLNKAGQPARAYFAEAEKEFLPLVLKGNLAKATLISKTTLNPIFEQHRAAIVETVGLADTWNKAHEQHAAQVIQSRTTLLIVLGLLLLGAAVLLAVLIGRGIMRSLTSAVQVLEVVATGDLRPRLQLDNQDEMGQMGQALNQALDAMQNVLHNISQNSQILASAAEELTANGLQMGQNMEETSAQAVVVSAAAEEVSSNVQTVAAATEEMTASIKEIARNVSAANDITGTAVTSAEATNILVTRLGESSTEIGNVLKVITSIAEQTNLLALNATIEAARAGEAGKGFAVVANEVKELAKETAKATEEIGRKVGGIQTDTTEAVAAIQQINQIIHQISEIQTAIAGAVEEQTVTTNEINRNIVEAARGSSEIAGNIHTVAQSAQTVRAGVTDNQAAASELSRLAQELQQLISQFQFDAESGGNHRGPGQPGEARPGAPLSFDKALLTPLTAQR
ncbi:MAG: methyl-accepting chemotaxis protein [Acidobacteria bacterium]|nr:methyl-accepting chemotaxis protein [Acidobacteriota bacterium]MBI3426978.1 methyl-accepting chemotaxis protein [Acidobacteriota bacterium]